MRKLARVPQPAIDLTARPSERRRPWGGLLLAAVGLAVLTAGLFVGQAIGGETWSQWRLVRAVTASAVTRQRPQPADPNATTQPAKTEGGIRPVEDAPGECVT